MTRPIRLGVLTPSSSTSLKSLTSALVAAVPVCSAHFSRFAVTEISLSAKGLGQFDDSTILAAAELLADAKFDVIGWSGTAAGWLGFDCDRRLVKRIQERTGIRATTAVLALNELMGEVAASHPHAVTMFCTNLRAAPLAAKLETQSGIPLLDSVSTTVWGMLRAVGADPKAIRGWGRLFDGG